MILHYSVFTPDEWGNGGQKRTHQIVQSLSTLDPPVDRLDHEFVCRWQGHPISNYLRGWKFYRFLRITRFARIRLLTYGARIAYWHQKLLSIRNLQGDIVLVFESSRYADPTLPYVASQLAIPIISLPHNLESLVPNQRSLLSDTPTPDWFNEELQLLSMSKAVFTISREEQWFLSLRGIPAFYLPYSPSTAVRAMCSAILRQRSLTRPSDSILMIGSALNPPTREGMRTVIRFWKEKVLPIPLIVAGFSSEKLREDFPELPASVQILGSVERQALQQLLETSKAVLIHQSPTSGALTKIPELLLCGVPILANSACVRSFHDRSGLKEYRDIAELHDILVSGSWDRERPTSEVAMGEDTRFFLRTVTSS